MKGRGKKHLHEPPAEFAEAAEARAAIEARKGPHAWWDEWEREQRREQIRNMKMPSHPRPVRGRGDNYETDAQYARRLDKWRKRLGK